VGDKSTLTLTTCNPRYSAATRMVVVATFDDRAKASPSVTPDISVRGASLGTLPGDSLSGSSSSWFPAILWGALTIAVVVLAVALWRLGPRFLRWGLLVVALA